MFSNVGLDSKIYRIFFVVFCLMCFFSVLKAQDAVAANILAKLEKGCNAKDINSCLALFRVYLQGDEKAGMKPNLQKAMEYKVKACNAGHGPNCNELYVIYYSGQYDIFGIKKDLAKAHNFAVKSCQLGYKDGCVFVASIYTMGEGVK